MQDGRASLALEYYLGRNETPVLDENGNHVLYTEGAMNGKPKYKIRHIRKREVLNLYIWLHPRNQQERTQNKNTLALAEKIRFEREQEFLVLMLDDQLDERRERTVGERNLAFAVDDVLLQIERHGLRLADVLHRLRYGDARLFADAEKTVHRRAGGENYGRMVEDFDSLAPELFQRDARHTDERLVFDLDLVLLGDFVERRFFDYRRPGLRNQYAVNFQL